MMLLERQPVAATPAQIAIAPFRGWRRSSLQARRPPPSPKCFPRTSGSRLRISSPNSSRRFPCSTYRSDSSNRRRSSICQHDAVCRLCASCGHIRLEPVQRDAPYVIADGGRLDVGLRLPPAPYFISLWGVDRLAWWDGLDEAGETARRKRWTHCLTKNVTCGMPAMTGGRHRIGSVWPDGGTDQHGRSA